MKISKLAPLFLGAATTMTVKVVSGEFAPLDYSHATATVSPGWNFVWSGDPSALVDGYVDPAAGDVNYPATTCDVETKDLGYVTIDLGESMYLDAVRVVMNGAQQYCNLFASVWDEGDTEAFEPLTDPLTKAPTDAPTVAPVTLAPTQAPTDGAQPVTPHSCNVCGDADGTGLPCDLRDVYMGKPQACAAGEDFCMTDLVVKSIDVVQIFKRCVTEEICRNEWMSQTSDQDRCTGYPAVSAEGSYTCHFCTVGDNTNTGTVPDPSNFYTHSRRTLQNAGPTSIYSTGSDHGYSTNVPASGELDIPIIPGRMVRYLRVWIGQGSIGQQNSIYEIIPLAAVGDGGEDAGGEDVSGGDVEFAAATFTDEIDEVNITTPAPPVPKATSGGDPHFKTFSGEKYDFHGGCDLVLVQNSKMRIHIRTEIDTWWSYIKTAVVQLGDDILEVTGGQDGGRYWLNGQEGKPIQVDDVSEIEMNNGLVGIRIRRVTDKQLRFRIAFRSGADVVGIETFKSFVSVNVRAGGNQFVGSLGMMGSYPDGTMLGRDGSTEILDAIEFGQEWQVIPTEPMLFREPGEVQAPQSCRMPDDAVTTKNLRRRLMGEGVTEEEAAMACEHADEDDRDACIFDVLATNDKELAGSY